MRERREGGREGGRRHARTMESKVTCAAAPRRRLVTDRDRAPRSSLSTSFLGVCFVPRPAAFRISQTNKVDREESAKGREREREPSKMPPPLFPSGLVSSFPFPSPVRFAQVSPNRRSGSRAACGRGRPGPSVTAIGASNPKGLPGRDYVVYAKSLTVIVAGAKSDSRRRSD